MRHWNQDWRDLLRIPWSSLSPGKVTIAAICIALQLASAEAILTAYSGLVAAKDLAPRGIGLVHVVQVDRWLPLIRGILETRGWRDLALVLGAIYLATYAIFCYFGAALFRMNAVEIATGHPLSIREARRFARRKFKAFFWTHGVIVGALLFIALANALGGTLGRIPWAGPVLVGLLFWIAWVTSAIAVLAALGLALGWDLTFATIAVEGTDPLDGISRGINYVFVQPGRFLAYRAIGGLWGAFLFTLVVAVALAAYAFAIVTVRMGMGPDFDRLLLEPALAAARGLAGGELGGGGLTAPSAVFFCSSLLYALVLAGYAFSIRIGLGTGIYLLLRRAIDGTDTTEIHLPDEGLSEVLPDVEEDAQVGPPLSAAGNRE